MPTPEVLTVRRTLLLALGWVWPFIVAGAGVAAVATARLRSSDGAYGLLLAVALLGSPAVVVTVAERLPSGWQAEARYALAVTITLPILAAELLLAFILLVVGANAAGPGWIE